MKKSGPDIVLLYCGWKVAKLVFASGNSRLVSQQSSLNFDAFLYSAAVLLKGKLLDVSKIGAVIC